MSTFTIRYPKWLYLKEVTFSKPPFWVSMLVFGGVDAGLKQDRRLWHPAPETGNAPGCLKWQKSHMAPLLHRAYHPHRAKDSSSPKANMKYSIPTRKVWYASKKYPLPRKTTQGGFGRFAPCPWTKIYMDCRNLDVADSPKMHVLLRSKPKRALRQHQGYLTVWPLNGLDVIDSHSAYFLDPKRTQKL